MFSDCLTHRKSKFFNLKSITIKFWTIQSISVVNHVSIVAIDLHTSSKHISITQCLELSVTSISLILVQQMTPKPKQFYVVKGKLLRYSSSCHIWYKSYWSPKIPRKSLHMKNIKKIYIYENLYIWTDGKQFLKKENRKTRRYHTDKVSIT